MGKIPFLGRDVKSKYGNTTNPHRYNIWIPHPFLNIYIYIYIWNPNMVIPDKTIRFPLPNEDGDKYENSLREST